ncbi:DNA recombination and repair protein Rad51-like C-terminal domain-containing protein [Entamoeba marina]
MIQSFLRHYPQYSEVFNIINANLTEPEYFFLHSFDELTELEFQGSKPSAKEMSNLLRTYSAFFTRNIKDITALEMLQEEPMCLSYGMPVFDEIFPFLTNEGIIEFAGEAGSGKTQLCIQIAVLAALSKNIRCYYLTEIKCHWLDRLQSMSEYFQQTYGFEEKDVYEIVQILRVEHIDKLKEVLKGLKSNKNVGLIIIDSFGALIKKSYEEDWLERSKGSNDITTLLHQLMKKGFIVIVTNMVADVISPRSSLQFDFLETNSELKQLNVVDGLAVEAYNKKMTAVNGHQWSYHVTTRLFFYKKSCKLRQIWDSLNEDSKNELDHLTEKELTNTSIRCCTVSLSNECPNTIQCDFCILQSHVASLQYRNEFDSSTSE